MHEPRHGKTVFWLIVMDAMPARNERARFIDFVISAAQHGMHGLHGHGFRDGHYVEAKLRFPTHGIHIRKRVGGSDLPKQVRVIGNRREKVHRLHQRERIADAVNRGVIAFIKANQKVGVLMHLNILQQLG